MAFIDTLLTVFFGVFGLGIIVFIHESGHFIAAKLCKIEVETFSLGWGKKLAGFKYKGTNYQISRFPIGGYCKMKGEYLKDKMDDESLDKMREDKSTFIGASPWKRAFIAFAGPLANLIFAAIIFSFIFFIGFNIYSHDSRIILLNDYYPDGDYSETPAYLSGLKTGDLVISINNIAVESFWDMAEIITRNPDKPLSFNIIRGNKEMSLTVTPENSEGRGVIGIHVWIEPVIGDIDPGSYASLIGLESGDIITAVNNQEVNHSLDIEKTIIELGSPKELLLTIKRGNENIEYEMPLEYDERGNIILGFSYAFKMYDSMQTNFFDSILKGTELTITTVKEVIYGIIQIFSFQVKNVEDAVAGPVRIISIVGENTTNSFKSGIGEGFNYFFSIISNLSIIIALMNLLPIPALDGGTIVISAFEQIRRKPLKFKNIFRFQIIGFSFIALLIVVALFSDIVYIIKSIFS
jgi:regulator of sigma E protease